VPESSKSHGNLMEGGKSFEDGDVMSMISHETLKHHWVLDTAASFHMTPSRDYFYTYCPCHCSVYMCGDNKCEIVRIVDVRIIMFNCVTLIVMSVQHVPDLRKSLLSLYKFDEHGYKFSGENGKL
jgi:hypothetical protein